LLQALVVLEIMAKLVIVLKLMAELRISDARLQLLVFRQINGVVIKFPYFVTFPLGYRDLMVFHQDPKNLEEGFRKDFHQLHRHLLLLKLSLQMGFLQLHRHPLLLTLN
jgi:hypothetical protein